MFEYFYEPSVKPWRVLALWVKVELRVMAIKELSTIPKAPEPEPHRQMQFNVKSKTHIWWAKNSYPIKPPAETQLSYSTALFVRIVRDSGGNIDDLHCHYIGCLNIHVTHLTALLFLLTQYMYKYIGCFNIHGTHVTALLFLLTQYIYEYIGCLNIHGTHVTAPSFLLTQYMCKYIGCLNIHGTDVTALLFLLT